jgi:hypothetical protein
MGALLVREAIAVHLRASSGAGTEILIGGQAVRVGITARVFLCGRIGLARVAAVVMNGPVASAASHERRDEDD